MSVGPKFFSDNPSKPLATEREGEARRMPRPALDAELISVLREPDSELYCEGLNALAARLKSEESSDRAYELWRLLEGRAILPERLRERVRGQIALLQGGGSLGSRAEQHLGKLVREATDWRIIAPMAVASIVGSLGGTLALGRLVGQPASLWTRGVGARFASGVFGFAAEGLAFTGLGRLMSPPMGESFPRDLARSYLGLSALRLSGSLGRALMPRTSQVGDIERALERGGRALMPQVAMFFGMLTSRRLEAHLGLRPGTDADHGIVDTVAAMVGLQVGASLGRMALGKGFQGLQQETEVRNAVGGLANWARPQWARPAALGFEEMILMSEGKDLLEKGGGPSTGRPTVAKESPEVLELKGEFRFADPRRWTEAEIDEVVKAVVAQDAGLYPGGDARPMLLSPRFFKDRWYRVNGENLTLNTLACRVRRARGLGSYDIRILSQAQVLKEWKERLFGLEVNEKVRVALELSGKFSFNDPRRWTEAEIDEVVKAIVAQDTELYPGGDVRPMSSSPRYYSDRWYRVNGELLTLNTLVSRVRRARGLGTGDTNALPTPQILREWKERLFGFEEGLRGGLNLEGEFRLADSQRWTEAEIDEALKAIVAQDTELYPGGNAESMSGTSKHFRDRRYVLNGRYLTLNILAGWVRLARGLKTDDLKTLPNSQILREWKGRVFGLPTKEPTGEVFELKGEFKFADPKNWTEAEIGTVVKAIVAQDGVLYPGGDARPMSSSPHFFCNRRYLVNGQELTLNALASRVRRARGLKWNDTGLPASLILREWKEALGFLEFSTLSPQTLDGFIREADLGPIMDLFGEDPGQLIEALSFLRHEDFRNKDITEFVKAYVGLRVEGGSAKQSRLKPDPGERRRKYLQAVLDTLDRCKSIELSEVIFSRQLRLLIRLSRKSFEEAPERLIQEMLQMASQAKHAFLQRLQLEAAAYFREAGQFLIKGMRTRPHGYQREGAYFLATHKKAILADEAGMGKSYQAIAAAESLGLRRVLWVTTAANKETLREEIFRHSQAGYEDIKVVISGDPGRRREQVQSLKDERYVLTNYETLVAMQKSDPEGYAKLTGGLDLIVVDEAQLTDNIEALRTRAIQEIVSPRRWLLTATPYQSRPEQIWSLLHWLEPERYPEFTAFKQLYCQSTQGLFLLHQELSQLMLRRTKRDTLFTFKPPQEVPFDRQLADGIPRLPDKERLKPEHGGGYKLNLEQADLIAWMTANFHGWAEHFNRHLPDGAEPVDLTNLNSLQKFDAIQKVIYEPERYGIALDNPIFPALDKRVEERLARGEKVILWAWNTSIVDALERRYQNLGVRRIDGSVAGTAREEARRSFQEDPKVRVLVANYRSGGVGLTLSAAHSAIFVQLPRVYPALYQAEGRHQRLIGLNNLRHAKEKVYVEWMVPSFPEKFIAEIQDAELREILSHGTLVEQTRARLEGGETLYHLLMEGYGEFADLEEHFKVGLIKGMGLNRSEPMDYVSHLKGEAR